MDFLRRVSIISVFLVFALLLPNGRFVSAETLADIDAEIQTNKTIQAHRPGLDAYNIYDGVTDARLDRKITILKTTNVNSRFYQRWDNTLGAYVAVYDNFYSFTGTVGGLIQNWIWLLPLQSSDYTAEEREQLRKLTVAILALGGAINIEGFRRVGTNKRFWRPGAVISIEFM